MYYVVGNYYLCSTVKQMIMKKILLLIGIVLLFSCEKEIKTCKICKTQLFAPEAKPIIIIDTVCYDIKEGYFITVDSIGRISMKTVGCEAFLLSRN